MPYMLLLGASLTVFHLLTTAALLSGKNPTIVLVLALA